MTKVVYTNSQLSDGACSLKEDARYRLKLQNLSYKKNRALNIGSLVHDSIDVLYRQSSIDKEAPFGSLPSDNALMVALSAMDAKVEDVRAKFKEDLSRSPLLNKHFEKDAALAKIMVRGYYLHFFLSENFEMAYPESEFAVAVVTPSGRKSTKFVYAGKRDNIIRENSSGRLFLHELKTKGKWDDEQKKFLKIDAQVTGYQWASLKEGIDIHGIIYTVIIKTPSKFVLTKAATKRKAAAKKRGEVYIYDDMVDYESVDEFIERISPRYLESDEYYHRYFLQRTEAEIKRFEEDLYFRIMSQEQKKKFRPFPEPQAMTCSFCSVFEYCAAADKTAASQKYGRKNSSHEELNSVE